mgnify:CR=1 FL=1
MSLNRDQINSIAHLARLSLTEAEIPVYQDSLSKIVDLVGRARRGTNRGYRAHGSSASGSRTAHAARRRDRKDQHELYQRNAPQVEAALYLVPKVIE